MSKPFEIALQEWKKDKKYAIGDDIGDEYYDYLEAGPTPVDRSLTQEDGSAHTEQKIVNRRQTA